MWRKVVSVSGGGSVPASERKRRWLPPALGCSLAAARLLCSIMHMKHHVTAKLIWMHHSLCRKHEWCVATSSNCKKTAKVSGIWPYFGVCNRAVELHYCVMGHATSQPEITEDEGSLAYDAAHHQTFMKPINEKSSFRHDSWPWFPRQMSAVRWSCQSDKTTWTKVFPPCHKIPLWKNIIQYPHVCVRLPHPVPLQYGSELWLDLIKFNVKPATSEWISIGWSWSEISSGAPDA